MNRITISLPEALVAALNREARRRRVPISQVAREAIEARLQSSNREKRVIPFAGIISSGKGDIAANFEEYLAATWADVIDRDRDP